MILTPHILVGAAIGAKTQNLGLIIILGIVSHFILDKMPHWDYDLPSVFGGFIKDKNFKKLIPDLIKVALDIALGLLAVFIILKNKQFLDFTYLKSIIAGILASTLPDVFLGIVHLTPGESMRKINYIGDNFLHYRTKNKEKEGKVTFLGLTTQILVIILSVIIFFS